MQLQVIQDIRSYLAQFTDYPLGIGVDGKPRPLCALDYDWTSVQIKVNIGAASADGLYDADNSYNGPKNFHSLVFGVEAHLAINDWSDEKVAISNVGNPSIQDRLVMIGNNIKIELENLDKQGGTKIIHNAPKRLSSFMKPGGVWFPVPILIQNADSLKVTASMIDEAADVAAGDYDAGLDIWILQVRSGP